MIKLIKKFLGVCDHEWETIERISVWETRAGVHTTVDPRYLRYVLKCKNCGNIKSKDV